MVASDAPAGSRAAELCGVVLAAGAGTRLQPLTRVRPKALCPVGGTALVDLAVDRVRSVTAAVAVNVHHDRVAMEAHLAGRVHVSVEQQEGLGTAGALGHLRPWIDGRATVVVNADTWCPGPLDRLVAGWDGAHVRVAVVGDDELRPRSRVAAALMPWSEVAGLAVAPTGLWEVSWRRLAAAGRVDVVRWHEPWFDCGTPARYLHANLVAGGGAPLVEEGARVEGRVERSVVLSGSWVGPGETLTDAIRAEGVTILVR